MDMKKIGIPLIIFTAVVSGISIFINSYGVKGFDSSVFTFSKNILVALILFAAIFAVGQWKKLKELNKKQWLQLSVIGLVGGSVPFLMFFKGLQMTSGATGGFIHKLLFVFVLIFAGLMLKERPTKGLLAGAILIIGGTYLMLRPDFSFQTGHLLMLGATVLWALENVLAKRAVKNISGTVVAWGRMGIGSLFIFVFLLLTGKSSIVWSMTFQQYMWIIVTSAFLFLYVLSFYNALATVKVTTATMLLSISAPITTAMNYIIKGSILSSYEAFGMLFILLGAVVVISYSWILQQVSKVLMVVRDGRD
ncbi:MAG: DMT family transporter [Candidatus Woesearchaeota archaeon]